MNGRWLLAVAIVLCAAAVLCSSCRSLDPLPPPPAAASAASLTAAPLGTAKGVKPGRVVWVHDRKAVHWDGEGDRWYDPAHFDQPVIDRMMSRTLRSLTGRRSDSAAWGALFREFNKTHGRGNKGYRPGEKIMIKANLVGLHRGNEPENLRWHIALSTTPAMIQALVKQLVEGAGVRPEDITVGDPSSYFPPMYFDPIHAAYPEVNCLAFKSYEGRVAVTYSDHPFFWSTPAAADKAQDYVPAQYAEATYLINFAVLKAHNGTGVTLCGKNHYGSLIRMPEEKAPDGKPYFNMHSTLVNPLFGSPELGQYRCLVDLMGHADLGGKTMLCLLDGLLGGWDAVGYEEPRHPGQNVMWHTSPFNDYWPCSLLASQDPVAIDSVGLDILREEAPYQPGHYALLPGTDDYLREAALADHPPSGTFYDPNHPKPTTRLESLGTHEHWDNPIDRRYSRNLGTGNGIELITLFERD